MVERERWKQLHSSYFTVKVSTHAGKIERERQGAYYKGEGSGEKAQVRMVRRRKCSLASYVGSS